jgi:hypothetical protein
VTRKWNLLFRRSILIALAACILVLGPYYAFDFAIHRNTVAMDVMGPTTPSVFSWLGQFAYYWQHLPQQLGWPLLVLSALGIVFALKSWKSETTMLMFLWILSCYITFTFIPSKSPRYNIYWVPAFIYFGTILIVEQRERMRRMLGAGLAVALVTALVVSAWTYQRPYVAGYAPIATRIGQMANGGVILFDGVLPGNFIFFMRGFDPGRHFVILRKALYVSSRSGSRIEVINTRDGLLELIRNYGIRFIVVMENAPIEVGAQQILRDALHSPQFRLVERSGIDTNERSLRGQNLLLYENLNPAVASARYITVKMLTLPHDIVVPLK